MSSGGKEEATVYTKVMIDKKRGKLLFAEADSDFVDILLSFLTLPLGRIVKILDKEYGDEAPAIGSISSLYRSLENLDSGSFVTEGAKNTLLDPISSFEDEYKWLKLNISGSQPSETFCCGYRPDHNTFYAVSMYYDQISRTCRVCGYDSMRKGVMLKPAPSDGVLTLPKASFVISEDLQIFPNETGLLGIISILGIEDTDKATQAKTTSSCSSMINLLKASLTWHTPLSDLILPNGTTHTKYSATMDHQPKIETDENHNPNSKNLSLRLMIQKSSGKVLYAQAVEDFVEFLSGLLFIPLGGVEKLLGGMTGIKAIDNLYRRVRSATACLDDKYFKSPEMKNRLLNPNLPHGCISDDYILPLTEEPLPHDYTDHLSLFSSVKFPKSKGTYFVGPRTYKVTDDLTVMPYSTVSVLSDLNDLEIPVSDVQEMAMHIGLKEGLSILKASLTSSSALSDALLKCKSMKQPKREQR